MSSNSSYNIQSESAQPIENSGVPSSPPPSYENALAEVSCCDVQGPTNQHIMVWSNSCEKKLCAALHFVRIHNHI